MILGYALTLLLCWIPPTPLAQDGQQQTPNVRSLAQRLSNLQYEALATLRKRDFDRAIELLRQLDEIADQILHAPRVPAVYQRRARGAKVFLERMKERYPEVAKAFGQPEEKPTKKPATEQKKAMRPGSAGTVSFVEDIAPIIVRNCLRCHGARNPRSGFSMATYNSMLKGGERGDDVVPGKPDESLLVLLLQGKEEPRMPPNRALRRDLIELFVKWVEQGAKFDGGDKYGPDTPLEELVPSQDELLREKLAAMSDSELLDYYRQVADRYWKAALPSEEYKVVESRSFLAFTNADESKVRQLLEMAERTVRATARFRPRGKRELWRGKLVIFIYKGRYYYSEHTRMVERRELPYGIYAHFRDAVELPYVACYLPGSSERITPEIVVGLGVAEACFARALPTAPDWLRAALAMRVTEGLTRRAEYWTELEASLAELVPVTPETLGNLLEGKLPYDEARLLGYALLSAVEQARLRGLNIQTFVRLVADANQRKSLMTDEQGKAVLAHLAEVITKRLGSG